MKERCVARQPWREELSQRRIELDRLFFNRRAHHEVRITLLLEDLHDLARRFVVLAQARPAAMGQFHRVSAGNVEAAMILPDQSSCRRKVASNPTTNAVGRLAPAEELGKRFASQHDTRRACASGERQAGLQAEHEHQGHHEPRAGLVPRSSQRMAR